MQPRVWTYQVVGGNPFSMAIPNNPAFSHGGNVTIYHMVGSEVLSNSVYEAVEQFECRVTLTGAVETQEQTAHHQKYLESEASLFPCAECTGCFWLDLQLDGYCGFEDWAPIPREQSLKWYPKARADAVACPLGRGSELTG